MFRQEDLRVVLDVRLDAGVWLNAALVAKQGLSEDDLRKLKWTHRFKFSLVCRMLATKNQDDIEILGKLFTKLLFFQQKVWKFDQNEDMHNWKEIPHCICPDKASFEKHVINQGCPVHGYRCRN